MSYVVIEQESRNGSITAAYAAEDKKTARDFLQKLWEERYNEVIADRDLSVNELETYHEDDFAQILFWDGNHIRFTLCSLRKAENDEDLTDLSDIPDEDKAIIIGNHEKLMARERKERKS